MDKIVSERGIKHNFTKPYVVYIKSSENSQLVTKPQTTTLESKFYNILMVNEMNNPQNVTVNTQFPSQNTEPTVMEEQKDTGGTPAVGTQQEKIDEKPHVQSSDEQISEDDSSTQANVHQNETSTGTSSQGVLSVEEEVYGN